MITRIQKTRKRLPIENFEFCDAEIGHDGKAPLITSINQKIECGHFYWVHAAAGVGRTTFLRVLSGLHPVLTGQLKVNGQVVEDMTFEEFGPYRANIGYAFPQPTLLANRTLYENLQLPVMYNHEMVPDLMASRFRELSERFDLERYRDDRPFSIPGGHLKIVGVLRALMREPEVAVLDDPFIGLTPTLKANFIEYLDEQLRLGIVKTVFFATDDFEAIERFNPTVISIVDQKLSVGSTFPHSKVAGG